MSLRTGPVPRMAGDLTFMRSHRGALTELNDKSLAIIGIPMEDNVGLSSGSRMSPQALRETSVYFGWQANPQFSHPVDIDARKQIDTSSIHDRMVDLGDIPVEGLSRSVADNLVSDVLNAVRQRGASIIALSGDQRSVRTVLETQSNSEKLSFIQIGGHTPTSLSQETLSDRSEVGSLIGNGTLLAKNTAFLAPLSTSPSEFLTQYRGQGGQVISAKQLSNISMPEFREFRLALTENTDSLVVNLDLSAFASPLHGMSSKRRFNGVSVTSLQSIMTEIGQSPVSTLIVTGMNPTVDGMSVVKTGQRLLVTVLLGYIYGRLGLSTSLKREEY